MEPTDKQSLEAIIERVTFYADDTGYTVLQAKQEKNQDLITVIGELPPVHVGESVIFTGQWTNHPKYGTQFRAYGYQKKLPATLVGLEKYLGSGLIEGVGAVTAKRMIDMFGLDIIRVIEKDPDQLLKIPLIGAKKRDLITKSWRAHHEIQNVMIFLQEHDMSTAYAVKIYKKYGDQAIEVVQQNPYKLAEDIWGIGFKTADNLALSLGHDRLGLPRLKAGLIYSLQKSMDQGHLYLPKDALFSQAQSILGVPSDSLDQALEYLGLSQHLILTVDPDNPHIYLYSLYHAEIGIAQRIDNLLQLEPNETKSEEVEKWLEVYQDDYEITLSKEQVEAVVMAAQSKVFILTGGPGTGKTTVSKAIIEWFETQGKEISLASPTGRAAKRLSEVSGHPAKTIHRLLEFDPHFGGFKRDDELPLEMDVLLLDEVSMIDLILFFHLLQALPTDTHLILIGDVDQLPSVGPGSVLKDLLDSQIIPAVCLQTIFRQAQESLIVQNAHKVNQGIMPLLLPPTGRHREKDAFFIATETPEQTQEALLNLVANRLPKAGHEHKDIQVLSPMIKGLVGTQTLNETLQALLNPMAPEKIEHTRGNALFRVGDHVMQLKNNYDRNVCNGDLGKVYYIDLEGKELTVDFADELVTYDFQDLDELRHSYAMTVHKSQGSEYPVVVLPLTQQHYIMLQRNLLYTAMTRAKSLLIIIGSPRALQIAVDNNRIRLRNSHLKDHLTKEF